MLDKLDKLLLKELKSGRKTTYNLWQKMKEINYTISWTTIKLRLYNLKSKGYVENIKINEKNTDKVYWFLA